MKSKKSPAKSPARRGRPAKKSQAKQSPAKSPARRERKKRNTKGNLFKSKCTIAEERYNKLKNIQNYNIDWGKPQPQNLSRDVVAAHTKKLNACGKQKIIRLIKKNYLIN